MLEHDGNWSVVPRSGAQDLSAFEGLELPGADAQPADAPPADVRCGPPPHEWWGETTLLPDTRIIDLDGRPVETLVSQYVALLDGRIQEVALDFYARTDDGAVWYFGEARQAAIDVTRASLDLESRSRSVAEMDLALLDLRARRRSRGSGRRRGGTI